MDLDNPLGSSWSTPIEAADEDVPDVEPSE